VVDTDRAARRSRPAPAACAKSRAATLARALALAAAVLVLTPAAAEAHGPTAPVATSYLARLSHVPPGLDAKVVDGYVRLWLRVAARETVTVLDYRGAPYVRFTRAGVAVNTNSMMYYLNQTPVAQKPPAHLTRVTPPHWVAVGGEHSYEWHDGRLQALAVIALAPGQRYVGRWSIPLRVDGRLTAITGRLWHAARPSIAWFWPIVVVLACVLAAWRLRRHELDVLVAQLLGLASVIAIALADVARELHGRPSVTPFEYGELAVVLAFVAWAAYHIVFRYPGYFSYLMVAFVALWEGLELFPTLLDGYVLLPLPATLVRIAAVTCLSGGAALALLVFRLADWSDRSLSPWTRRDGEEALREVYGTD
jgi:hypothetical protein